MSNFVDLLTAAKLGNEEATLKILEVFESKIKGLAKGSQDLKAELVMEVLEQIRGIRNSTFNSNRLTVAFWRDDSAHNWNEYLQGKFVLWTNLQLSRLTLKKVGKSNISVHIPWYVATATKHYNNLLNHFGFHEEVVNFVEGRIEEQGLPIDVVHSKTMLLNNLKHKGRKNLLDKVRTLVSEIPFEPEIHNTPVRPDQEFRMLTKEFILERPCNLTVRDRLKSAAMYKAAGKINERTEEEFINHCKLQLTPLNSTRCSDGRCKEYTRCQKEWKDIKGEII